ncbi:MAG: UDP-glucose 4-epimerase GalE [Oscillospiraceae bacterium]|nr:UDP-glucose 4-epimerase GalE [Oscillospiraceae bacterium]
MLILVTGGTGFIGSHTCVELLKAGHGVIILDNLYNSKKDTAARIEALGGGKLVFYEGDIRDRALLDSVFARHAIDAVIHFAGLKAVGESCAKPLEYYGVNIGGTVTLCEAMRDAGCKAMVFSSSATVYGSENFVPFREDMPTGKATNPYGSTKIIIEQLLRDLLASDPDWQICLLRYFNPVGAHPSGQLGEDPNGIPNNLMPIISEVALGRRDCLQVFGGDYDTPDGTGVRDYIHVVDLAQGHIRALENIVGAPGCAIYNLGTGKGLSVLELVRAFTEATGVEIPCKIVGRRPGDIAYCYADVSKAKRELDWEARLSAADMCADVWRWLLRQ